MKFEFFAAAAVAVSMAGAAQAADTHATLELGYTREQVHIADASNFGLNALDVRGGYQFNKNWGVEMEGAFGVNNQSATFQGSSISWRQDWELGMYAVGYLPLAHNIDLIGRAGYSRTQLTGSANGISAKGQDNGGAVGVGVRQFPGGGANGWRVDYTHHFYNGSDGLDSFSVGYVRRF